MCCVCTTLTTDDTCGGAAGFLSLRKDENRPPDPACHTNELGVRPASRYTPPWQQAHLVLALESVHSVVFGRRLHERQFRHRSSNTRTLSALTLLRNLGASSLFPLESQPSDRGEAAHLLQKEKPPTQSSISNEWNCTSSACNTPSTPW